MNNNSSTKRNLFDRIIGPPLPTSEAPHQSISNMVGLAVFASDALSSTAYATEEILIVLAAAGTIYFNISIPIAIAITALLILLTISYRQTIHAYPNGGGAYIVAKDNLGEGPAQIAAAALLLDYILTAAVSISSGVAQIISAFPELFAYKVIIALVLLGIMMVLNLRGVKESGSAFAIPTFFFVSSMLLTIIVGFVRMMTGTLDPVTAVPGIIEPMIEPLSIFLILRAFSSGCTALTGVEAISNGIPAFKEPKTKNAANTLSVMSIILAFIFISLTVLSHQIGAQPSEVETVISQLGRAVFGTGIGQIILLIATTFILIVAANTSFNGFPRLAAIVSSDGFLPRQLSIRGSRLVYTWGIILLSIFAAALLVLFDSNTTRLIPLYAIGVFLSFTLSQFGMVVRWWKSSKLKEGEEINSPNGSVLSFDKGWKSKFAVSLVGGIVTFIVMIVFTVTKFSHGAWVIILLIPLLVALFFAIKHHYKNVARQLSLEGLNVNIHKSPVLNLLLVDNIHVGTVRLVNFAESLGVPWEAVHIQVNPDVSEDIQKKWNERIGIGKLNILPSPYRSITGPLQEFIVKKREEQPELFVHLLFGQLAFPSYLEQGLHSNTNLLVDLVLRNMDRVVITFVPFQVGETENYIERMTLELWKHDSENQPEIFTSGGKSKLLF